MPLCASFAGQAVASDRDTATAAAAVLCASSGANIIRAHNARAVCDAVRVADAVHMHCRSRPDAG